MSLGQSATPPPAADAYAARSSGVGSAARSLTAPSASTLGPLSLRLREDCGFVIDYAAPGCVIGHLRNMTFSAWDAAPTAPHVEAFMAMAQRLAAIYPRNSNLSLVMRNSRLPGAEARASLEVLTARYAPAIHSVALVIDGGGFWASMIRSFLTGLHVLRRNGYRCQAFASPAEANPWLLPLHNTDTGVHITEREMKDACDAVVACMKLQAVP